MKGESFWIAVTPAICISQTHVSNNRIDDCTREHDQMAITEIKQTMPLEAGDGKAALSLPKQDQKQIVVLTTNC